MKYVFYPEALNEYSKAVRYYAEQRVDLAQSFINAVEDAIYRLKESPNRYPIIEGDLRRCLIGTFPYGILYSLEQD
ncbi:MAG: type II toxin-antitoxin system RelE/ParE family toxin [Symploca sp. SIO3C6]|nr:type II toxin-antitoxin system RelE/ParE family toxin [Symploca sp. SIO3C6]